MVTILVVGVHLGWLEPGALPNRFLVSSMIADGWVEDRTD
jgi:hypothetical protein